MNAPLERGQENIIRVQLAVLLDDMLSGKADEATYARFRVATKFLPDEAKDIWVKVEKIGERLSGSDDPENALGEADKQEVLQLKQIIDKYASHLEALIATFDPETMEAYTNSLEAGDTDTQDRILEHWATMQARAEQSGPGD